MEIKKTLIVLGALLYAGEVQGQDNNKDRFDDMYCLAKNIYFESRNQPDIGKIAVAQVVMNRVNSERFPDSVCGVVQQGGERRHRCQFSWYCDGKSDEPTDMDSWDHSVYVSLLVYGGQIGDITDGAMWYHADYVKPSWSYNLTKTIRINDHIFYK